MARIRTVKPQHWNDKQLTQISLPAHLLWIGMWNFSDDEGIIEADPIFIRSQVFPRRTDIRIEQVSQWLDQLVKARFLVPFEYKNESYYVSRTFSTHQKIDKPQPSKIPSGIIRGILDECSTNDQPCIVKENKSNSSVEERNSHAHQKENSDLPNNQANPPPVAPPPSMAQGFFPNADHLEMPLPEMKVGIQIERVKYTKQVDITEQQVLGMWGVFKAAHFTGKKYYKDTEDVYGHFGNWLKDQKFSNGQYSGRQKNQGQQGEQPRGTVVSGEKDYGKL